MSNKGCPKCGTTDTGRFTDGATVCIDCLDQYDAEREQASLAEEADDRASWVDETTPSDVIRRLGPVLDETGHVFSWDHTGGGCMMITITREGADESEACLGITPEDGPFTEAMDEPIADHHENSDLFMVIHYGELRGYPVRSTSGVLEQGSDHEAGCLVRGDNLTAVVKEWATTGEISGWDLTGEYDFPEVTGRPLTACTYTEDVWVCRDGVLVLHRAARESFWLHDESEVTTCPGCDGSGEG